MAKPLKKFSKVKKDDAPKIYCLFHEKHDCSCIKVVVDTDMLKIRLDNAIKIHELQHKHISNRERREEVEKELVWFLFR